MTGKLTVGSATFSIVNGHAAGDVVAFSTIHNIRIINAAKTEKLDKPAKFNYKATITGDKCHLVISHADGTGTPSEFDLTRSKD